MFKLLKKSLSGVISKFSKGVDGELAGEAAPNASIKQREVKNEQKKEVEQEEISKPDSKAKALETQEEVKPTLASPQDSLPKGIRARLASKFTRTRISEQKFDELFWNMEINLLQNNMARKVIEKIKEDLKEKLINHPIPRKGIANTITKSFEESLRGIMDFDVPDIVKVVGSKKPFVMLFVGVNGSGKTTTIAKLCKLFLDNNKKCVMVAGDTFRAAAIQQLEEHANRLKVKLIKHDYGADPAAVAYDGVEYAKAHGTDVVLIDTAGRLHTNANLMDELKKVKRVAKPDLVVYVGESITGNDCIEQATIYNNELGIDGIVLTKVDVDENGGAPLSIAYVTGKPIFLLGTGQEYKDLVPFDKQKILASLNLS